MDEEINNSFRNFLNRPKYEELTIEVIDNASDDDLVLIVFDNLSLKLPDDYKKHYETVLSFSKARQALYIAWWLDAELNNGGFNQYYENPTGQFAELAPDALKLIGAVKFSALLVKANGVYEREYKKITEHMDGTVEGFAKSYIDNPLDELDKEFYSVCEVEDLQKLMVEFIRKNKSDFKDK